MTPAKGNLIVTTSWDDGTITDTRLAQLLEKYDVKGTFYIPQAHPDNLLPPEGVVALDKKFEIGAHSINQPDLTRVSAAEAEWEIKESKTILEKLLGHEVLLFCYPRGKYNESVKRIVKDCGFIAARTCNDGGFAPPTDPYQWHTTMQASNSSPLMALRIWLKSKISLKALFDWESRAKMLFDLALKRGGVYHIWAHSREYEVNNEWDKLERVLQYISRREGVSYLTNGEALARLNVTGTNH